MLWVAALAITTIVFITLPFLAFFLFKLYNSPDGERYRKRSMQGPCVPLDAQDPVEDETCKATATSEGSV